LITRIFRWQFLLAALLCLLPGLAWAQEGGPSGDPLKSLDKGDIAWLLVSTALVLLMTPGLALFYGGMVRRKNVLGTYMQSFVAMGIVTVLWVVIGYSLAFAPGNNFYGGLQWAFLNGVSSLTPSSISLYAPTTPQQLHMAYQLMFAIITPALISGAFAERKKFSAYLWFISIWLIVVYCPLAHMVWGSDGWLGQKVGALDFAGGTVVHISSGVSALVAALIIGKRRGYPNEEMRPHNLTTTLLGTGILWFGWFGFNGGSALAADGVATTAFVNTHVAAAMAMLAWMFVEWAHRGKPTALGAASGAVAGLVGITPGAGYVDVIGALVIGTVTSGICYAAVMSKSKLGYDDSLDTFGVHGVGGTVGALLTGVFCKVVVNAAGKDGLVAGNPGQLWPQAVGVLVTWVYAGVASLVILVILDKTIGLRMKPSDEQEGMDLSLHGEEGYGF
jgi:Amt family ammonium transporter